MRKFLIASVLFVIMFSVVGSTQAATQDVVYLKNGSVVRGSIIEQVPNVSLKLKTADGNIFVYMMEDIEKIAKGQSVNTYNGPIQGAKSPGVAWVLSFIFPGVGQYYNGDVGKGVIMSATYLTGYVLVLGPGIDEGSDYYYDPYYGYGYSSSYSKTTTWLYVGLGMMAGSWVWSMVDAPRSAKKINKQRRQQFGHMLEFNTGDYVVGMDFNPRPKNGGFSANMTLHF